MTMSNRWVLGLLLFCTMPVCAQAQPATSPSQTDGSVVIQFLPPVGKPLHYQVTRSGKADAQRIGLRFERSGDGYLMHATNQLPKDAGVLGSVLAQPVTFKLDIQGKVTGIVDENAYWRRVDASLQSSTAPADVRATAGKFRETVRAMTSEQRAGVASSDYRRVIDWAGTHRSVKPVEGGLGKISMEVLPSPDTVTIIAKTGIGPDNLADFLEFLRAKGAPYDGPARPDARFESTYTSVVDRASGLLRRSEITEVRDFAGKVTRSTKIIQSVPARH